MPTGPGKPWIPIAAGLFAVLSPVSRLSVRNHAATLDSQAVLAANSVDAFGPVVTRSAHSDVSGPLRDAASRFEPPVFRGQPPEEVIPEDVAGPGPASPPAQPVTDPVVQRERGLLNMPDPLFPPFEGISSDDNFTIRGVRTIPPDPNGAVGPFHYVQTVNRLIAVYDKEGTPLLGPIPNTSIFDGFEGPCGTDTAGGDPTVLYDHLADRWLFSYIGARTSPFHQCIAVTATGDPTDAWFRYDFVIPSTQFNDYPHFGVWPDGYYMAAGGRGVPGEVFAFERDQMLNGESAQMITFRPPDSVGYQGLMPSDLDGSAPDFGTPNYFVGVKPSAPQAVNIFQFHVDWVDPLNSTFGLDGQPNASSSIGAFSVICPSTRDCIPQPGTTVGLDALAGRLVMYRAQYRSFPDHDAIVFNHTVDAGGRAGVRWYEVLDPGGAALIQQQGTFAPDDGVNRWMGSAAMDGAGDLAIGYSAASASVYPSIYYAGRLATDPLGGLTRGEAILQSGSGSQTSASNRWGDYTMLAVDPVDDCTFWYTNEYVAVTASASWQTKIGAFAFPQCASSSSRASRAAYARPHRQRSNHSRLASRTLLSVLLPFDWVRLPAS